MNVQRATWVLAVIRITINMIIQTKMEIIKKQKINVIVIILPS